MYADHYDKERRKNKMTGNLEQEVKRPYEQICSGAQELSLKVANSDRIKGFEDYISELNKLHERYIAGFLEMDSSQRADSCYLLDMLQSQIHGRLDVFRAKVMRGALRRKKDND